MFKLIDEQDINYFQRIADEVIIDEIHSDYWHDEMMEYGCYTPDVVVSVSNASQVSELLKYCSQHHIAVTPRGSGTGLCGGCVAIHGGVVLSLVKMNKILEVDRTTLTATVEPGVFLMEINEYLTAYQLAYVPDPGEKSATIGGNVMTNAGGMRAVKYGVTRNYILGLEVVLASGEILQLGGKSAKNSSGYSLKDLMIGSEGTLGVVTKIILKLIAKPNKMISLLIPFKNIDSCLASVNQVLLLPEVPVTLEFMEKAVIEDAIEYLGKSFPNKDYEAYLLVSYEGNSKAQIEQLYSPCAKLCLDLGAIDVFISDTSERQTSIWDARGAFLEAIKNSTPSMDECDVCLAIDKVSGYLSYVKELAVKYDIRIRSFGHAGDGNLHIYVCQDSLAHDKWEVAVKVIMQLLYDKALELGGQVSGEHGIGHAKKGYLRESLGEEQIQLMQGIKQVFDPQGILNPGKIIN